MAANLYQALDDSATDVLPANARAELAWSLGDIYEYKADMSRDLRDGDHFQVLFERKEGPGGIVRIGDVDHVVFSKCTAAAGDGPAPAVIYVVGADVRENSPGALPETDRNAAMNAG